jgi:hypothetical protein
VISGRIRPFQRSRTCPHLNLSHRWQGLEPPPSVEVVSDFCLLFGTLTQGQSMELEDMFFLDIQMSKQENAVALIL